MNESISKPYAAERRISWRTVALILVLVVIGFLSAIYFVARADVQRAADSHWAEPFGPIQLRLRSVRLSRTHGLWLAWQLHFSRTHEHMPGDVALWQLCPFRSVTFTKDWWSRASTQ